MKRKTEFEWPDGQKAAVCMSWDVDGESALYVRNPDQARNQLSELTQRSYGPEVGLYKILDNLDSKEVKATFYVPGYTARLHEEAVSAIKSNGHAFGLHGYMHESMELLDEEAERNMFDNSIKSFREILGIQPTVFRSPSFELNRRTPALLLEKGIKGDSSLMGDDFPYAITTENGNLIELPVQWILDDAEFWGHTRANRTKPITDPETVFRIWKNEFDGIYNNGGCFVLTMHPFISGRWAFLDVVFRLLDHIHSKKDVWLTTTDKVTDYCAHNIKEPFMVKRKLPATEPIKF